MTGYTRPLTVFHKKDELTKECKRKIINKNQYYHNHRATHNPITHFKLSRKSSESKVCTYCFSDVIIEDYE